MEERGLAAAATLQPRTSPRGAAAAAMAARDTWGDVPDNILVRVSAFLRCHADRVHMVSVNLHWSRAVRGVRRPPPPRLPPLPRLPPQLPWLIFPSTQAPTFYSPVGGSHHRLCRLPPDARRARCCGSAEGGWLVLAHDASHHAGALYNLNSRQRVPLPPAFVPPTGARAGSPFVMRAAAICSAPYFTVAAVVDRPAGPAAAFWSEGSDSWSLLGDNLLAAGLQLQDVVCYNGRFFFVTTSENVIRLSPVYGPDGNVTIDCETFRVEKRWDYDTELSSLHDNCTMKRYLVGSRGNLLMVVRYVDTDYEDAMPATEMIRVFRLHHPPVTNGCQPRPIWVDLLGELDGRMLFLGPGCSRSFEVARYDGFRNNMIYFLDEGLVPEPSPDGRRWYMFTDMGRYDLYETITEPWPPNHPTMSDHAPPTWWLH